MLDAGPLTSKIIYIRKKELMNVHIFVLLQALQSATAMKRKAGWCLSFSTVPPSLLPTSKKW